MANDLEEKTEIENPETTTLTASIILRVHLLITTYKNPYFYMFELKNFHGFYISRAFSRKLYFCS